MSNEDFQLARTLPENRSSREPVYLSPGFGGYNLYHPDRYAAWPDGAWDIEVIISAKEKAIDLREGSIFFRLEIE